MRDEDFDEVVHRVLEEHRAVRLRQLEDMLREHCICTPRHTAEMVVGSVTVCEYARYQTEAHVVDGCVWMLDDIHDTIFEDHEPIERLN